MKPTFPLVFLLSTLFLVTVNSKKNLKASVKSLASNVKNYTLPGKNEEDSFFSADEITSHFDKIVGFNINKTINPELDTPPFLGFRFTTQQFDSLFPGMASIDPPQNASFNFVSKIQPFGLLNFSGGHLSVDFNIQIGVLLPGPVPFTSFNVTGSLQLAIDAVHLGLCLYINDYTINSVDTTDSDPSSVNENTTMQFLDTVGKLAIDDVNKKLAEKVVSIDHILFSLPSTSVSKVPV